MTPVEMLKELAPYLRGLAECNDTGALMLAAEEIVADGLLAQVEAVLAESLELCAGCPEDATHATPVGLYCRACLVQNVSFAHHYAHDARVDCSTAFLLLGGGEDVIQCPVPRD